MNAENMRVRVTKRMLREGLLRCLKHTSIDKLSVSELCRESGVNRATFYNHYEIPKDILMEIGMEYADEIKRIFELICTQPEMFPLHRSEKLHDKGYRYFTVDKYLVFYTADTEKQVVFAHAIVYGARELNNIF